MKFSLFDIFNPHHSEKLCEKTAFVFSPHYNLALDAHVFPAHKFGYIHELIQLDETIGKAPVYDPQPADKKQLAIVHDEEYLDDFLAGKVTERTKFSELPLNSSLIESFLYGVGGTIKAMQLTSEYQFVYNIGGGFHHAYADHAEGFCYLNDVAIAANLFLQNHPQKKVLIIDLDLHQGNGTAVIFQEQDHVYTFSMHQQNLYPHKEKSSFDIALHEGCGDKDYLHLLENALHKIESEFQADIIFYLAGADPFHNDTLGDLNLSLEGLQKRDRQIKNFAKKHSLPVVVVTAGGYAKNFQDTVTIHYNTAKIFAIEES